MTENRKRSIFLAEDDEDDRLMFEDALREVGLSTNLTTAHDGQQLMQILHETVPPPPELIFLDLNMPRKNGIECLDEIKQIKKLKDIPVVIFSTSMQEDAIFQTYKRGANYYIRKPGSFRHLKKILETVLSINWKDEFEQPSLEKFILQP